MAQGNNEFPEIKTTFTLDPNKSSFARISRSAFGKVIDGWPAVTTALGSVFAISCYEGYLLCRRPTNARFVMRYGFGQLLPSIIWLTKCPKLVCSQMGRPHTEIMANKITPAIESRVFALHCLRSVIAGFVGIAQILRVVDICTAESNEYAERIRLGKEPMLGGVNERIIRLSGSSSDVTEYSLRKFGQHIIPIFENAQNDWWSSVVSKHAHDVIPVGWNVPNKLYSKPESWGGKPVALSHPNTSQEWNMANARFQIGRDWLVPVLSKDTGGSSTSLVLIVEADSSVGEQALALGNESANDLTVQEASQAFRMIEKIATEQCVLDSSKGDRIMRVLLTDSHSRITSGGGYSYSVREHCDKMDECDIIIDAKVPLVKAVLSWAENASKKGEILPNGDKKPIIFDTTNAEYFKTMKHMLEPLGWKVLDRNEMWKSNNIPVLVYQDTTADTVNTIHSLLKKGLVKSEFCCALLDSNSGLCDLDILSTELGTDIEHICSSQIYDELFQKVRQMIRSGNSANSIQSYLDAQL